MIPRGQHSRRPDQRERHAVLVVSKRFNELEDVMTASNEARGRIVEQRGLWFEEFVEGTTYLHRPGRTVTEADNVLFTTLTMNVQPLHLDATWCASQPFGERLINSMFTLSTLVGLSVSQLTLGTLVANLGFAEVEFPHPVRIGDTLYAETLVVGVRPSKGRPGEGVVNLEQVARNQDGVIVARCARATLVQRRPEGTS
jgi:acyl dehydratase